MNRSRREFLHKSGVGLAFAAMPRISWAQMYPYRPVRVIVGFSAGGTTDIAARLMGQWLSERLGQPVIIDNRPGAGANIAAELAVRSPADGYTLLATTSTNAINASFYPNLSFNIARDIAMIGGIVRSPLVLVVNPAVPVKSVQELVSYAKSHPEKLTLASYGNGSTSHVAGELFKMKTGAKMLHVPYRGSAPMVADLMSGQVQAAFDNLPASIQYIKAGKLRALAVGTAVRSPALPEVPTVAEFVSGFEASAWIALGSPKGTPPEVIARLNTEMNAALADPKILARLASLGGTALPGTPTDFDRLLAEETEKWGQVVRAAGIKAG